MDRSLTKQQLRQLSEAACLATCSAVMNVRDVFESRQPSHEQAVHRYGVLTSGVQDTTGHPGRCMQVQGRYNRTDSDTARTVRPALDSQLKTGLVSERGAARSWSTGNLAT